MPCDSGSVALTHKLLNGPQKSGMFLLWASGALYNADSNLPPRTQPSAHTRRPVHTLSQGTCLPAQQVPPPSPPTQLGAWAPCQPPPVVLGPISSHLDLQLREEVSYLSWQRCSFLESCFCSQRYLDSLTRARSGLDIEQTARSDSHLGWALSLVQAEPKWTLTMEPVVQ